MLRKFRHIYIKRSDFVSRAKAAPPSGFALVVTLSLMIMLFVIAMGMLSLSSIELRRSTTSTGIAEARANARLALVLAIGQLQKTVGPDTRVTADGDLIAADVAHPHWTGIWKTRTEENLADGEAGRPVVDHHKGERYLSDSRMSGRRIERPDAMNWLVSSAKPDGADPTVEAGLEWVTLMTSQDPSIEVRVEPVALGNGGRLGWWTSDESQKALLPLSNRNSGNPVTWSLAAAQNFDFEMFSPDGSALPLRGIEAVAAGMRESVVSIETASLLPIPSAAEFDTAATGHHLTTWSRGLFTDVKRSGLKRDLSTFLALGDISERDGLEGIREADPILSGEHHVSTSPRFGILKSWDDLADQIEGVGGVLKPQGASSRFLDIADSAPGLVPDLLDVSKAAVQPVVVEASLGWDFSPRRGEAPSQEFMRGHLYPRLVMWNPFNVGLKATRYLVLLGHPTYGGFSARGQRINTPSGPAFIFADICGQPKERFVGFVTEPTDFEPGETKVFTPSVKASSGPSLFGKAARFDPLNYAANVLSADQVPGVENFYGDTMVPLPPETSANRHLPYGFTADMNNWFAGEGNSDEFIVCQIPEGRSGAIKWADVTRDDSGDTGFSRVGHFFCQNWGLNRYPQWYGAESNHHPSNNGTPFREFRPGAPDIGAIDNRQPPRLWRRGVRMFWFDETAEHVATGRRVAKSRYSVPWIASANLRGGMLHHGNWVNIPYTTEFGWQFPGSDSHIYFQQPTDPQLFQTFFPPPPFGAPDSALPTRSVIYDVPRPDTGVISLGQLQHAQLSYLPWHPSLTIGHSRPTMNADLDASAIRKKAGDPGRWRQNQWDFDALIQRGSPPGSHADELLVYDLSFVANEALWDRYMLSSIPFADGRAEWDGEEPLPVGRYRFNDAARKWRREALVERLAADPGMVFRRAAEFLVNEGAFNVNSTSVEAWKALLASMRGLKRDGLDGGSSESEHPIARSLYPGSRGKSSITAQTDDALWSGFRSLSDKELDALCKSIVAEVRARGPFLSLADFVNRRLVDDRTTSRGGTLESAISRVRSFNGRLDRVGETELRSVGPVASAANRPDSILAGLPGYLSQGDLLTGIAPVITVRGDTFRVRAYGEWTSPDGHVFSACCEAFVQRAPDYLDPSDDASRPVIDDIGEAADLQEVNRRFGRRLDLLSFRWLAQNEFSK